MLCWICTAKYNKIALSITTEVNYADRTWLYLSSLKLKYNYSFTTPPCGQRRQFQHGYQNDKFYCIVNKCPCITHLEFAVQT